MLASIRSPPIHSDHGERRLRSTVRSGRRCHVETLPIGSPRTSQDMSSVIIQNRLRPPIGARANPTRWGAAGVALGLAWLLGAAPSAGAEPWRLISTRLTPVEPLRIPLAPTIPPGEWRRTPRSEALASPLWRSPLIDEGERQLRIAEGWPRAGSPIAESSAARVAALRAARLFEAAGDPDAARFAYERAVLAGARDFATWRGLARTRLLTGDGPGAESAYLAALEATVAEDGPVEMPVALVELQAQLHRDLLKVYGLEGRGRDAALALERSRGLAALEPPERAFLSGLAWQLSPGARPMTEPLVWPDPEREGWATDFDVRVGRLASETYAALPASIRVQVERAAEWASTSQRRRVLASTFLGLLAFLVMLRAIRQRGDLSVAIEYPEELRGVFRVRVISGRMRLRQPTRGERGEVLKGGVSSRFEHHLVNRETHFQRLLTRRYEVVVEGVLLDPDTDEILSDLFETKIARVRHRRTVRIEFDVRPDLCPVDVEVAWGDNPATDIGVVAPDHPETLRRASGSRVRLFLPKGEHRLAVGCGDRVLERMVEVTSYQPTRMRFDLAGEDVIFKGCPPAVAPYLEADIEAVAQALERDGQAERAYLMLAQMHETANEDARAADYYESAGHFREAAELHAALGDHVRAATLFERAELPIRAAEMYRRGGDLVRAGQAYELAQDMDLAIECYREAPNVDRWINALERRGEVFVAAQVALENDQRPRGIRLLQCVAPDDEDYAEACLMLTAAFEREEHWDLASQKLEQNIGTFRVGTAPAERYARLADLLENAGAIERSLEVLEDLRRREPTYPGVAARIEHLRKARSAASRLSAGMGAVSAGDAPTAFVAESRYEVLSEIGRGGMGVVFKARDRRLDRVVALKRLPEDLRRHQPRAVQLFLREAQAAARLNHPNIVTVYDTDQEDGHFFITMELLDGQPFNRILRERGRLSASNVITVGLQVAAGLEFAHSEGIVHRDVKTANLFLTSDKVVKIMDFGLAKMFEEVRGGTTVISGTPFYMSPEQILGGSVDARTDLYSLGVTLYELATGNVPFAQGDIAYHHRHTPPTDPRELRSDLPDGLAELLLELLEKDVDARVSSAESLAERLDILRNEISRSA